MISRLARQRVSTRLFLPSAAFSSSTAPLNISTSSNVAESAVIKTSAALSGSTVPAQISTADLITSATPDTWQILSDSGCLSYSLPGLLHTYVYFLHEYLHIPWFGSALILGATFPVLVGGLARRYQRELDTQALINKNQDIKKLQYRVTASLSKVVAGESKMTRSDVQKIMADFKKTGLKESPMQGVGLLALERLFIWNLMLASERLFGGSASTLMDFSDGGLAINVATADPTYWIAFPLGYLFFSTTQRGRVRQASLPWNKMGFIDDAIFGLICTYFIVSPGSIGTLFTMSSYALSYAGVRMFLRRPQMERWKFFGGFPRVTDTWKWATLPPSTHLSIK